MALPKQIESKSKILEIDSDNNSIIKWEQFNSIKFDLQNCRNTLLDKFENLANQFAAGWKYHISNTNGIKEAWINFEDFYTEICLLSTERELLTIDGETEYHNSTRLLPAYSVMDEYRTSKQCDELLTKKVDALVSKLSPNWTIAITNISDTSKAWKEFKHYFRQICARDNNSKFFFLIFVLSLIR
ncbi:rRNA biogenesis protein [Dirofilaria immitis]